jgi:hypothetical protein
MKLPKLNVNLLVIKTLPSTKRGKLTAEESKIYEEREKAIRQRKYEEDLVIRKELAKEKKKRDEKLNKSLNNQKI